MRLSHFLCLVLFSLNQWAANTNQKPAGSGITLKEAEDFLNARSTISFWDPTTSVLFTSLVHLQNSYANYVNTEINEVISRFINGRSLRNMVGESDMLYLGPLLMKDNSPLLQKLSVPQALSLHPLNRKKFVKLVANTKFSPPVNQAAKAFLALLEMNSRQLTTALGNVENQNYLKAEPTLIDALLPHISYRDANYHSLKALKRPIKKRHSSRKPHENFTGDCSYLYGKKRSKRTNNTLNDEEDLLSEHENSRDSSKEILLFDIDAETISKLVNPANTSEIKVHRDNLWFALSTARKYKISSLAKKCDHFTRQHNLLGAMTNQWLDDGIGIYDAKSLSLQWQFCSKYHLNQNKDCLTQVMVKKLSNLSMNDDEFLRELMGLPSGDIKMLFADFDYDEFRQKLRHPQFLAWIFNKSMFIAPLKKEILKFCLSPENEMTVKTAWIKIPDEFAWSFYAKQNDAWRVTWDA